MAVPPIIAVVDDEESVRRALKRLIRSCGFDVESFASGAEFLRSLSARAPDCLVLDIHMPGMTGFDVQSQLNARQAKFPIVFITALDDPRDEPRALGAGAFRFLRKPIPGDALLDAVRSAIAWREKAC